MLTPDRWARVRTLLEEIVARPADDRLAHLAAANISEPDIREEVESLLRAYDQAGDFLETSPMPTSDVAASESDAMPVLTPGTRLGWFEILGPLGAGGMGQVYRARDTRLERNVAVKVMAPELADSPSSRDRFESEARAISRLTHPHICVLHDVGVATLDDDGDHPFLVMELVEGQTLSARLERGALPPEKALQYGVEIADALSAAHSAGIVHRDLKPANIMLTKSGAKLLDFGLAALHSTTSMPNDKVSGHGGLIAGTLPYMAPEQLEGRNVDARADIFAFGAVLYEMVRGQKVFEGENQATLISAILSVPYRSNSVTPPALDRVIRTCLAKDPDDRWTNMHDVGLQLQGIADAAMAPGDEKAVSIGHRIRGRSWRAPWTDRLAAAAAALALGTAAWVFWPTRVELPPMRVLPVAIQAGYEMMPTLSPDGEQVAFAWNGDKGSHNFDIYVSIVGSPEVRQITTDPAFDVNPSWSPDGKQIVFVRYRPAEPSGRVYVASPLGGGERRLTDLPVAVPDDPISYPYGQVSWSPDGRYIAVAPATDPSGLTKSAGIHLVATDSGATRVVTNVKAPAAHRDPAFSPDGRRLAYFACNCCYAIACDLMVVDLDDELAASGTPRRLASMVTQMIGLTWTPDGKSLVYGTSIAAYVQNLWRVDSDGRRRPERIEVAGLGARKPAIAPSHNRLVFERRVHDPDIYLFKPNSLPRAVITTSFADFNASFSPDGTRIVYASSRSGDTADIWVSAADGSTSRQLTHEKSAYNAAPRWSPDGRAIAFVSRTVDGQSQIWTVDPEGGHRRQITKSAGEHNYPSWSRDGGWIYFSKHDGAGVDIWRIAAAGGQEVKITHGGGYSGFESKDGISLVYRSRIDRRGTPLLIAPLSGGTPVQLLECVYGFSVGSNGIYYYACRSDRFAWTMTQSEPLDIHVIDPATRRDRLIGSLAGVADRFYGPIVSPDGTGFLFAKVPISSNDLMVIENFK